MLKLLLACFKNRRINLFIIVGIILFLFPDKISETAPYIVGIALIVHAALNAFIVFRSPESDISLGGAVVSGVTGILLMLDPFEHFAFHVRILGLEMIAGTLIHRRSED